MLRDEAKVLRQAATCARLIQETKFEIEKLRGQKEDLMELEQVLWEELKVIRNCKRDTK